MRIQSEKISLKKKVDGHYIWVRISFYQANTFYNIPNCYAKIWVSDDEPFPPDDKFLLLEDIVLSIQSEDTKKRLKQKNSNLVALKNMETAFPGSNGKLYVNTFQIASIMPIDPKSELIADLNRITTMRPIETPELPKEQQPQKSVIQFDEKPISIDENENQPNRE